MDVKKTLPERMTRGKRLRALMDEELEEDEVFWSRLDFNDEKGDNDYTIVEDERSSDDELSNSADEADAEANLYNNEDEKEEIIERKKKRLYPPGNNEKLDLKYKKKKLIKCMENGNREKNNGDGFKKPEPMAPPIIISDENPELTMKQAQNIEDKSEFKTYIAGEKIKSVKVKQDRGSSNGSKSILTLRNTTLKKRQISEKHQALQKKLTEERKKRYVKPVYERLTKKERIREAARNEVLNTISLNELMKRQEEQKEQALETKRKEDTKTPILKYISKKFENNTTRTIIAKNNMEKFPERFKQKSNLIPKPCHKCIISGEKAKYKDPVSGLPYANKEAFQEIRRRISNIKQSEN